MKNSRSLFVVLAAFVTVLPALISAQVDTVWVSRWTSPGAESDWAYAIAVDDSGYTYVTGKTNNAGTNDDWTTIKYTPDGDTVWVRNYVSPGSANERASSIAIGASGNVYITGYTMSTSAGDYLTIKYRPDGDTAWTRRYNGIGNGYDFAKWVTVDNEENVYVTGYSRALSYQNDIATVKYDSTGDEQWVALFNGPGNYNDEGCKVVADNDGHVYVTGYVNPFSTGTLRDYVVIKYNAASGDTVWARTHNGTADSLDQARDVEVDAAGNVYVTGSSRNTGTQSDIVTIKYDADGVLQWVATYDNPDTSLSDGGYGLEVDGAGNVYVVGQSQGLGTGSDIVTIKYDSLGSEEWVMRYNGPDSLYDTPSDEDGGKCMAMDQYGNVYIAGVSRSATSHYDYVALMYSPDGIEQWVVGYDCCDTTDYALAVAIDTSGGVYVCGRSLGLGTYYDMATVKYQSYVGITGDGPVVSGRIQLEVQPNPFARNTTVRYALPVESHVSIFVYDAAGRMVKNLVNERQIADTYAVLWDGTDDIRQRVPSGVYFYVLDAGDLKIHRKIVMVR
ncbi:SBBP repeat-containing protein [candidate division WOR-3 bacterium]|nr:SBBP repeat-containing protein [candidate division WOR-3 bacterium]